MINPLPNNSEDSLKIFYHLTEETRYPALILFILSIVICLSISKGEGLLNLNLEISKNRKL